MFLVISDFLCCDDAAFPDLSYYLGESNIIITDRNDSHTKQKKGLVIINLNFPLKDYNFL